MALLLQRRLRIPLIVTLHGYDVTSSDESLRTTAAGRAYVARREELWKRAHLFVCVSEHIRQKALERGFPEHKLWVHRIGIDLGGCTPAPLRNREPVVLFVGRLVEKKGCIHLIRAMARVNAKLPGTRLVVIGDGPLRGELEREARERLQSAAFLGTRPIAEVRSWMQRARMLVAPSVVAKNGDAEGLPTVLCEAQAMGLPVVAFRGPGVDEAVVDGDTALLVNPLDEEGLGAAILRLSQDAFLQARLRAAGRRHAEEYFDLRRQTELLEDKYDEVLSEQ
jgi:glycosyltransferase involved in cell wall biosynthesis